MPRIPMSDKGGLVQHQRDSVPMSGAPGMSFKLDEGQAWKELGAQIGRAGESFGGAMMNYAKAAQDTDNKLAASQARNLFNGIQGELGNRMAENPQDFGKFREWAQEADKRYADEVKQYTDKMSQGYRKEFEVEMDGLRTRALQDRVRKGIQAKVTADYELLQAQWKDAALRGDEAESRRLLDEHRGVLISEQEYQQKLLDYERMRDCGAAKRLLESGERGLAERLRARNKDGSYAEFPKMDDGYREKMIRAAKSQDEERTRQLDENLLKRFTDGDLDYGDVKEAYDRGEVPVKLFASWQRKFRELKSAEIMAEAEETVIALKTKSMDRVAVKEKFETLGKDIDEALKTGELSSEQANELKNGLKKQDFAAIRNAQEWAKKAQEDAKAKELLELAQADIPSDSREREVVKKQMFEAFRTKFPDNWQAQTDYLNALDKRFKEDNVFSTPEGKLCRDVATKAYKNGQLYYDPWGPFNKEKSPEFQAARYVELLKWQENELRKGTPVETIVKGTNDRIADLNAARIKNFLSVNLGGIRPNQSNETSEKQAEASGTSEKQAEAREVPLREGKRGTYQGKPVIVKGGKVVEDEPPRYSLKFMNDLAESDFLKGRNNDK